MIAKENILYFVDSGICHIVFNRPEKLNAITPEMLKVMAAAVDRFREDDTQRVLMISSRGKFFSAGMDISAGMASEDGGGVAFRRWYRRSLHQLFDELEAVEKPVIVAIHAPCLGGALELALSCDFRLASTSASFGLPEIKLGVIPGSGGTSRLVRLTGTAFAKRLIMTGKNVSSEVAFRAGLVQEVWSPEEFDAQCQQFAEDLCGLPVEALAVAKICIDTAADLDRTGARNLERLANTWLTNSDEHLTLVREFTNRKKTQ
jgi:enoyl-CoA hydratase